MRRIANLLYEGIEITVNSFTAVGCPWRICIIAVINTNSFNFFRDKMSKDSIGGIAMFSDKEDVHADNSSMSL